MRMGPHDKYCVACDVIEAAAVSESVTPAHAALTTLALVLEDAHPLLGLYDSLCPEHRAYCDKAREALQKPPYR